MFTNNIVTDYDLSELCAIDVNGMTYPEDHPAFDIGTIHPNEVQSPLPCPF